MARPVASPLLLIAILAGMTAPAAAQFGTIFGNDPPRPPGNVPNRPAAPSQTFPQDRLPPGPPPGVTDRLPPGPPPNSRIQSQPLPPPPGSAPPTETRPASLPPAGQTATAPNAPPPAGGAARPQQPPASAAVQPSDEVVIEPPAQKIPNPTAVFSGLDKITGRIMPFEVAINETVRFGALEVTPRACYTRPPTEAPNTDGFIEVDELTLQGELRRIFTGWMFVTSPGLNAVEHPIYDVWLTDCKGATQPSVAEAVDVAPAPAPPPRQQRQQRRANAPAAVPNAPLPPTGPSPGLQLPPPPLR